VIQHHENEEIPPHAIQYFQPLHNALSALCCFVIWGSTQLAQDQLHGNLFSAFPWPLLPGQEMPPISVGHACLRTGPARHPFRQDADSFQHFGP